MQVTPSSVLSASRTQGSVPCRAATCAHANRRAALTANKNYRVRIGQTRYLVAAGR